MEQPFEEFAEKIRLSSSISEELDIVKQEQSLMRTFFNNSPNPLYLPRAITKAIFLEIMGYNVSYAQIPSIQLMSNEAFSYKRIGYIVASILLNQSSQMSVLVTQILIKDLNSKNKMVKKLALTFIANLCVPEVCSAVAAEVNKLLMEKDYDLLKGAGMAIVEIVRLNPDLSNNYKNLVQVLLNSNNHGIVNAGINLVLEILKNNKKLKRSWASFHVPFTKILMNLTSNRINREFIKNGFNDPFMQIKVLKVLQMLGKNSPELENILQTLISSLPTKKNSGRAILFQTVETICAVSKKASLIGLAYNQIGRLLSLNSSNIVYSSLSVLSRILSSKHKLINKGNADSMALQRYKEQITRCLDNKDPSIRMRALDVIISLIDKDNVDKLIPEVMLYIKLADNDFRRELVSKVYSSIQEFAPNNKWHFETVYQILVDNGSYFSTEIITSFCDFITETPEIISFAIQQFTNALANYINNQSLIQVSAFVIGEFSTDDSAFDSLIKISQMPQTQNDTLRYVITAIAKLSTRVDKKEMAYQILYQFSSSNDIEIQQRSGELMKLLLNTDVCEEMLAPIKDMYEIQQEANKQKMNDEKNNSNVDDLLNLIANESELNDSKNQKPVSNNLLDEIYSLDQNKSNIQSGKQSSLLSNDIQQKGSTSSPPVNQNSIILLQKDNYIVYCQGKRNPQNPKQIALQLQIYSKTNNQMTNFKLEFQESPGWKISVMAPSSNILLPSGGPPITQVIYLLDMNMSPFSIRITFSYLYGTQPINETSIITTLPQM